jgi:hypothetical protein
MGKSTISMAIYWKNSSDIAQPAIAEAPMQSFRFADRELRGAVSS